MTRRSGSRSSRWTASRPRMAGQVRYRAAITTGDLKIIGPADFIGLDAATIDTAGRYSKLSGELEILHPVTSRSFLNLRLSGQTPQPQSRFLREIPARWLQRRACLPRGRGCRRPGLAGPARLGAAAVVRRAFPARRPCARFVDSGAVWLVNNQRGGLADPGIPESLLAVRRRPRFQLEPAARPLAERLCRHQDRRQPRAFGRRQ